MAHIQLIFHFRYIVVSKESYLLFKFIFSWLPQSTKFDVFQESFFNFFASRTNLVLKHFPIQPGQSFCSGFTIISENWLLLSFSAFSKKLKLKDKLSDNHRKTICRLFCILPDIPFIKSERELDYHLQAVNIGVVSQVAEWIMTVNAFILSIPTASRC